MSRQLFITTIIVAALVGFSAGLIADSIDNDDRFEIRESSEQRTTFKPASQQEQLVVDAVERTAPAVVNVIVTKDLPVLEQEFIDPFGDDPFFRDFFGPNSPFRVPQYRQKGTQRQQIAGGTGFIVSPDGLVVTNRHVVADTEANYTVFTNDGERIEATVLARDPLQDLALLKIDRTDLPTVQLGQSDTLQIGQTVIAIGNALGEFRNTVSMGVISGLARSVVAQGGGTLEQLEGAIQTDAAINQGNSGGPLLNLRGEVIGVNTAVALGAENVSFSIPVNRVTKMITDVREHGRVIYPFLGVRFVTITPALQVQQNLSVDRGALLTDGPQGEPAVVPGSPADNAGLRAGDIILSVEGEAITQERTLSQIVAERSVGEEVTLRVVRDGDESEIEARLVEFE